MGNTNNDISDFVAINVEDEDLTFTSENIPISGHNWLTLNVETTALSTIKIYQGVKENPDNKKNYIERITQDNGYIGTIPICGKLLVVTVESEIEESSCSIYAVVRKYH